MLKILRRRFRDGQRLHEERVLLEERAPGPEEEPVWEALQFLGPLISVPTAGDEAPEVAGR